MKGIRLLLVALIAVSAFASSAFALRLDASNARIENVSQRTIILRNLKIGPNARRGGARLWWNANRNAFELRDHWYANNPNPGHGVVGKWNLKVDWDCDQYNVGRFRLVLRRDKTFVTRRNGEVLNRGTWVRNGERITLRYNNAYRTRYNGRLQNRNNMNGRMRNNEGERGCWSARRVQDDWDFKSDSFLNPAHI